MTFPVSYYDIPSSYNFPANFHGTNPMGDMGAMSGHRREPVKNVDYTNYAEGIWVGYRYFTTAGKEVSYPFGYGLSYTTFAYGKPTVKVAGDGTVTASITVTNTGTVAGKEAVQLYVKAPSGGLVKPERELKAFAKTRELAPGASETLTMVIDPYTLASFNEGISAWEMAAGSYLACFGASVADIRATAAFKQAKPRHWSVRPVCIPEEPVTEITVK